MTTPSPRRTALARLVLVLFAAPALAACQASGGALSREEFLSQANAICAEGNAEIDAAIPASLLAGETPTEAEVETAFRTIMASIERQVDEIDALEAPAEMQPELDSVIAETRAVMEEAEADGADAFFATADDRFDEVNARLAALGLTECAEDGSE